MRKVIGLTALVAFTVPASPVMGMLAQEGPGIVAARESQRVRSVSPLERRVTIRLRNVPLRWILEEIRRQTGLELAYTTELVPLERLVTLERSDVTIAAALREVLQGTGVTAEVMQGGRIALVKTVRADSVGTIRGRVTATATGAPVVGASVTVGGTALSIVTGDSGYFVLDRVPRGERSVTVRSIGFMPLTKTVLVDSVPVRVDFVLAAQAAHLDELVSTATGEQRRRDLGNSITTINADSVLQTAPIRTLTDLLEARVPGMTVQHTSGAPGDPSRLRLRGLGSVLRSNDPVFIVDGVRIYSTQSDPRSGNLTNQGCLTSITVSANRASCRSTSSTTTDDIPVPAPSPLDQIDPNIIEKIEVFKGPSAATLYGADAANGVIVITTKKGRAGPTRWSVNASHGRTSTPGQWPIGTYRWGHSPPYLLPNDRICPLTDFTCEIDSVLQFQALSDPATTVLGQGRRTALSLNASGGNNALTYSVTGSYDDEIGLLQLPEFEAERFQAQFNRTAPDWMRRPHHFKRWNVTSNVTALLSSTTDVTLTATLGRSKQERTALENQVGRLAGTYVDKINGDYYVSHAGPGVERSSQFLTEYYTRTTASAVTFTTGLNARWRPRTWFNATGQAGINVIPRDDERYLEAGLLPSSTGDNDGRLILGSGRALESTVNLQGQVRKPLGRSFVFETSVGTNLKTTNTADLISSGQGLTPGTRTLNDAAFLHTSERRASTSVFGWYIEPRITGQRLSFSTGIRLDGGSTHGTRLTGSGGGLASLVSLPKLNGSWVISEEPWFPFNSLFSSLRLRGAYGQAQVQPGPADRLRLYKGRADTFLQLSDVGNADLRPERSVEFEGGFDADILDNRVSMEVTGYTKTQVDALMSVGLPPSLNGGGNILQNIGNIRNRGVEFTLRVTPIQTPALTWSTQLGYSSNSNTLVKLGDGVTPNKEQGLVAGYPVRGRWARPILGYADENGNGVLERAEIRVGDSLVFVGQLAPSYTSALYTNVALFGGAVGITAGFTYESGAIQIDQTAQKNWPLVRALVDPSTPFGEQAAVLASLGVGNEPYFTQYGLMQEVSTFRFQSLSLNYRAPARIARLLRAEQMTVALQGSNLGLRSTYRGKDPNVNSWSAGEDIRDTGQLPVPRTWQISVFLRY